MKTRNRSFLFSVVAIFCVSLFPASGLARNDKKILKEAGGVIKGTFTGTSSLNGPLSGPGRIKVDPLGKGIARNVKTPLEFGALDSSVITKVMGKPKIVKNGKGIRRLRQKTTVDNPEFTGPDPKGEAKSKADQRGKKWKWKSNVVSTQIFPGGGGVTDVFRGVLQGKG